LEFDETAVCYRQRLLISDQPEIKFTFSVILRLTIFVHFAFFAFLRFFLHCKLSAEFVTQLVCLVTSLSQSIYLSLFLFFESATHERERERKKEDKKEKEREKERETHTEREREREREEGSWRESDLKGERGSGMVQYHLCSFNFQTRTD
jgi:cell shape-determining protein MreC